MANAEHLATLKLGVEAWNKWRLEYPDIRPDLGLGHLGSADLSGANLRGADLAGGNLSGATLIRADLERANLGSANFRGANLCGANVRRANLTGADLSGAKLVHVDLTGAMLLNAHVVGALFGGTVLPNCDLREVVGLGSVDHFASSPVSIDTIYKSRGKIPEAFLLGCGVPDSFIAQIPALVGALQPIQFYSCFISYSTRDEEFAKRLHERMRAEKLRVWFSAEDVKGGEKLHEQIERAIQVHDRLLLVLSENSIKRPWVVTEIRNARKAENGEKRRKLFLVRLCEFDVLRAWECLDADFGGDLANEIRQYFIPHFSNWKNHDDSEAAFAKLLTGLLASAESASPTLFGAWRVRPE
jgi:hypothetical protein